MGLRDLVRVFDVSISASDRPDYPLLVLDSYRHSLSVSFSVPHDAPIIPDDDETLAVDFSLMCETLLRYSKRPEKFQGTEELAEELCRIALERFDAINEVIVTVEKQRLDGQGPHKVGLEAHRTRDGLSGKDTVLIKGMNLKVLVGVHEWERMEPSIVTTDISLVCEPWKGGEGIDLPGLVTNLYDGVGTSDDLTLESLASSIARMALSYGRGSKHPSKEATVKIVKPKAVNLAEWIEVEVTRTAEYFTTPRPKLKANASLRPGPFRPTHKAKSSSVSSTKGPPKRVVTIAVGSNVGDRYANVENALRQMEARHEIITITGTSFLYESEPMYVEDQNGFLNCIIMAETTLQPQDLLTLLKHIEDISGRVKTRRYGPRTVDLDIIFFESMVIDIRKDGGDGSKEGDLVVPHPRLCEREFVLRPLNDVIPDFIHPTLKTNVRTLFNAYVSSHPSTLRKILPFPSPPRHPQIPTTLWPLSSKTYVMATINATPDSFSSTSPSTTSSAAAEALAEATAGADIIDVGGYSTRPGATPVSSEDELRRVVPVVRKIREQGITLPISVDTFRPSVLRAAVEAGANCLNDITALSGDGGVAGEMAAAARELGVPVVMMHSRGAHRAGQDKEYDEEGVLQGVRRELGRSVGHALRCGLRRWHIIVDPGFGFSKTTEGNLELLRRFGELTASPPAPAPASLRVTIAGSTETNPLQGFPTLAGLSRKSFLGKLLDRETEPRERNWATAASVTAAVQQGADVVRVHDVAEMKDVVKIADAVWRQ